MPSLNKVGSQIVSRLNKPFSTMLRDEVKDLFLSEIALLIRRTINKSGIDREYVASYVVELQLVDSGDNTIKVVGDNILRSVNRIPSPIRHDTPTPFIYVGKTDGSYGYGYLNNYHAPFAAYLPNIAEAITYDYVDGYLYVYNAIDETEDPPTYPTETKLIAPYADFRLLKDQQAGGRGISYDDDMELPYPQDLISTAINSVLQTLAADVDDNNSVKSTHKDTE